MKVVLLMLVRMSSHPFQRDVDHPYRCDYGLAGDGWRPDSPVGIWKRAVELIYMGVEQWQESWTRVDRRPVGWED